VNPAYLAAVERRFLERSGRGLMLSAADLDLVGRWFRAGVPVEVVLEGVDAAFERFAGGRIRGLSFTRRAVEAAIAMHAERRVGAVIEATVQVGASGDAPPAVVALRRRLESARVEDAPVQEIVERVRARVSGWSEALPEGEVVVAWEALLGWAEDEAWARLSPGVRGEIERALEAELAVERRRAAPEHFAETWDRQRRRLVRTHLGLPSVGWLYEGP